MLKVAILSSKRAPGIESILRHPERGRLFEIVCVVTTHAKFPQTDLIAAYGVPVISHPIRRAAVRSEYDTMTARMLRYLRIDSVVLLSYLYVLTEPMLAPFRNRIVNIHDSDLTITGKDGERSYVGLHSTRDAILAGERVTRSTLHVVDEKIDGGPIVLVSDAYEVPDAATDAAVRGDLASVKRFAFLQRERMMRAWGSFAVRGIHHLAGLPSDVDEAVAV